MPGDEVTGLVVAVYTVEAVAQRLPLRHQPEGCQVHLGLVGQLPVGVYVEYSVMVVVISSGTWLQRYKTQPLRPTAAVSTSPVGLVGLGVAQYLHLAARYERAAGFAHQAIQGMLSQDRWFKGVA